MTFNRRKFVRAAGATAGGVGARLSGHRALAGAADPDRPAHHQDRGARLRRHRHGARAHHLPQGEELHARRRKVELTVADSGGVPAQARTKMQELVERDRVQAVVGPLAAFEALAMDDYIRTAQMPTLPVAGAEDMTQRKANPWFVRATSTSAQCAHPMADYCAKAPQVQAHGGDRRRLRLRPRDARRLPEGVPGCGRHAGAEAVLAAQRPRLRQLHRPAQARRRRRLPRLRRLERLPLLQARSTSTA